MADLSYKNFDSLLASISEDLHSFDDNNLIVPKRYIKTARTCNSTLGIKINQQKEEVIQVDDYTADVPEDLLSVISVFALSVEEVGTLSGGIHGTHIQHNSYEEIINKPVKFSPGCVNDCGECYWTTRKWTSDVLFKDRVREIKPTRASLKRFAEKSPNRRVTADTYQVDLSEDKLSFNFKQGSIHLAYLADLVDEDGSLLVLDHPLTDDYYEWAIKAKIFQDLWHNSDADVQGKMQDARAQLGIAKQKAVEIVATPEYRKLKEYTNRVLTDYYNTYVKMFV